jgi:hypothetical protein
VIFFIGRSRDRIDARRMTKRLVFRNDTRRRDLHDHETAVKPALGREKRGELRNRGIDQLLDPLFRNTRDLGHRDRKHVHRNRDDLAVKISTAQNLFSRRKNEWIIGHGIDFALEHLSNECERIA